MPIDRQLTMVLRGVFAGVALLGLLPHAIASDGAQPEGTAATFFETKIQPLFEEHCFECHSHRFKKAKGGLVLDSRRGWEVGGASGPVVVPGRPDESLLMQAVRYEELEMPPDGRLSDALVLDLRRWILSGAYDSRVGQGGVESERIDIEAGKEHWAFRPLASVPSSVLRNQRRAKRAIDRFILAKLETSGIEPVADADPHTWLRRVSFDLTGLPPTLEEIEAFVVNPDEAAKGRVVDRLLSSRSYGERWARHWLDLVGYADQVGTSNNVFAEHAWRYRDYVVQAYNRDKPMDQFIREQIAGDLIPFERPEERADNLTATGFLVLGDIEIVEADKAKLLVDIVDQQLNKVGKAFLGMTLECARCHDHKFDPISQRDYFAMAGFFHGTSSVYKTDRGVWSDVNVLELPETPQQKSARARRLVEHQSDLKRWASEQSDAEQSRKILEERLAGLAEDAAEREALERERKDVDGRIGHLKRRILHAGFFAPKVPKAHGVRDLSTPEDMRMTIRGNPRALGERIPRGFMEVLGQSEASIAEGESGRKELAEWIVHQPLAARVLVNRIWYKLFGEGLVRSVDYFGLPGDIPSHPALLDYLARDLIENGWSQKRLIRSIVLSRTYGLSSVHQEEAARLDPENRNYWRMNRVRLDAEALRDGMLLVADRLKQRSGGAAMPLEYPENVGGLDPKDVNPPSFRFSKWRPGQKYERTLYLPVIRHAAQPEPAILRNVFDFPQPSQFSGRREVTAVPTQALFLMNSPQVKDHAKAVAARFQDNASEADRLGRLWMALLNRPITETEVEETHAFLKEAGEAGWVELCHALLASNEFLIRM